MVIPGYQEFMFPILKLILDDEINYKRNILNAMAGNFNLYEQECPKYKNLLEH